MIPPLLNPRRMEPKPINVVGMQTLVQPLSVPRPPKDGTWMPCISRVLTATMPGDSQSLSLSWEKEKVQKLGYSGFKKYKQTTSAERNLFLCLVGRYLLTREEPKFGQPGFTSRTVLRLWKSVENVVRDKIENVRLVEHIVTHPWLNYRGRVYCVACYEDELVVIQLKTAEEATESIYDKPLQVAAYCGAINCDKRIPESVIDRNITSAIIIKAYFDGSKASIIHLDEDQVDDYWQEWTARLQQYARVENTR